MSTARILVVDDDPAIRSLLQLVASRAGFAVDVAANGKEALERIAVASYAVMLLDLMMPVLSGYEVLERLEMLAAPPTVVLVSAMPDADAVSVTSRRVQGVLRKPFDVEHVIALLTAIVRQVDGSAPGDCATDEACDTPDRPAAS